MMKMMRTIILTVPKSRVLRFITVAVAVHAAATLVAFEVGHRFQITKWQLILSLAFDDPEEGQIEELEGLCGMHWNMCSAEVKPDTVPVLRRSTAPLMR
jgi:hypothetical protein